MTATTLSFGIEQRPDFSLVNLELAAGQRVFAEPSAMVTMDPAIHLKAGFKGGLLRSVSRMIAGESLVMNTFTAPQGGHLGLAPSTTGDVAHVTLDGANELYLQRGAFLAHGEGVEVSASWQGAKGFFSGEGMVLLRASGSGDLFFNTYGAMLEVDVRGDYLVDTGYVVAFESTLNYSIGTMPGLNLSSKFKTLLFGGEALVCRFSGHGKLWVQTRAVQPFLRFVWPFRPTKNRG